MSSSSIQGRSKAKAPPNGYRALNKYRNNFFIQQRSPDQKEIAILNRRRTLQIFSMSSSSIQGRSKAKAPPNGYKALNKFRNNLFINLEIIYSYDKGPQTKRNRHLNSRRTLQIFSMSSSSIQGRSKAKAPHNGYRALNKFRNNLFIRQRSPDLMEIAIVGRLINTKRQIRHSSAQNSGRTSVNFQSICAYDRAN